MEDQRREGRAADWTSRRGYLRAAAGPSGSGLTAAAGCPGGSAGGPNTHLAAPDREFDASQPPSPTHGDPLPEVTVSTTQFDRDRLVTFFYSHFRSVCPRPVSSLRAIRSRAAEDGYGDDVASLAATFDPEVYGFDTTPMVLLADADGYAERAYRENRPVRQDVYTDFATLREREGQRAPT